MKVLSIISRVLGLLSLLSLWQLISASTGEHLFSSPVTVSKILYILIASGDFIGPMSITLARVTLGMVLAVTFGVIIGILISSHYILDSLLGPLIVILMLTPSLLIVFLTIFTFGFLDFVPSLAAAIVHTPFTIVTVKSQLINLSKEKLEMAKVYCASASLVLRHIYLPYLTPSIMSELRLAFFQSWKIIVLSEIFGFTSGVGYFVKIYFASYDLTRLLAWTSILLAVILSIEEILRFFEKRRYRWMHNQ
jgi:NitT/TauT family transport system permease protein